MSAPDTNIDKQEKQHKPALIGIRGAAVFGVLMILAMLFFVIDNGRDDDATPAAVSSETTAAPVDPVAVGTNESN